jgi:hypothetical protein
MWTAYPSKVNALLANRINEDIAVFDLFCFFGVLTIDYGKHIPYFLRTNDESARRIHYRRM